MHRDGSVPFPAEILAGGCVSILFLFHHDVKETIINQTTNIRI